MTFLRRPFFFKELDQVIFGVRRPSEATTALWIVISADGSERSKTCPRSVSLNSISGLGNLGHRAACKLNSKPKSVTLTHRFFESLARMEISMRNLFQLLVIKLRTGNRSGPMCFW